MAHKVRTARGSTVDFSLLKIKAELAAAPVPPEAEQRRSFVDKKAGGKKVAALEDADQIFAPAVRPRNPVIARISASKKKEIQTEESEKSEDIPHKE